MRLASGILLAPPYIKICVAVAIHFSYYTIDAVHSNAITKLPSFTRRNIKPYKVTAEYVIVCQGQRMKSVDRCLNLGFSWNISVRACSPHLSCQSVSLFSSDIAGVVVFGPVISI